jgi:hypothetical protein
MLAQSESIYSSIVGDVTDSSGAAAPGVSVAAITLSWRAWNTARKAARRQPLVRHIGFRRSGRLAGETSVAPPAPIGRFGSAVAGILEGPGLWQLDFGLVKGIPIIREKLKANLFFFGTNIFNHPNLGNPNLDITAPVTAGHILGIQSDGNASGIGMRLITLGLRLEF